MTYNITILLENYKFFLCCMYFYNINFNFICIYWKDTFWSDLYFIYSIHISVTFEL